MDSNRKTAIIVGVLLISCTAATILSIPFSAPLLEDSDYLTKLSENETRVIIGSLFEFIWAFTCAGIAIWLYPILKKYNEALALGSVGFRIAEGVLVLVGTLCLLSLLTLAQVFVIAGYPVASSFQTSGSLLLAIRDWTQNVMVITTFNMGALMYYYLLYQSKLIPGWLSGWGIIGNVLSLVAIVYYMFTRDLGFFHTLLNAPIAVQEMVFAVWLIVKGFNPSAIASPSAQQN